MIFVYHASARSKSESPVANGAPSDKSFAGKREWNSSKTSVVKVLLSMTRCPVKLSKAAVSAAPESPRLRRERLKVAPSLIWNTIHVNGNSMEILI
jgi:hypothetical protein